MKHTFLWIAVLGSVAVQAAEEKTPLLVRIVERALGTEVDSAPDWSVFFGRFHIVLLHLPIGLLTGLFLLELYALVRRGQDFRIPARFLCGWAAVTSWAAVGAGLLLALDAYNPKKAELLSWHGWTGIAMAAVVTVAYLAKRMVFRSRSGPWRGAYVVSLLAGLGLLTVSGHYGGGLVHGEEYLGKYAPGWVPGFAVGLLGGETEADVDGGHGNGDEPPGTNAVGTGEVATATNTTPTNAASAAGRPLATEGTFYATILEPIIDRSCVECHGGTPGKKPKGDYDMTSYENVVDTDTLIPGDADGSDFIILLELPLDDDDHMPPEGKAPELDEIEHRQFRWWVQAGAKQDTPVTDAPEALRALPAPAPPEEEAEAEQGG